MEFCDSERLLLTRRQISLTRLETNNFGQQKNPRCFCFVWRSHGEDENIPAEKWAQTKFTEVRSLTREKWNITPTDRKQLFNLKRERRIQHKPLSLQHRPHKVYLHMYVHSGMQPNHWRNPTTTLRKKT